MTYKTNPKLFHRFRLNASLKNAEIFVITNTNNYEKKFERLEIFVKKMNKETEYNQSKKFIKNL